MVQMSTIGLLLVERVLIHKTLRKNLILQEKETTKPGGSKPVQKTAGTESFELDLLKYLCRVAGI